MCRCYMQAFDYIYGIYMTDETEIQDPLKPLRQICMPDERQRFLNYDLDDWHGALSEIVLNDTVPVDISQLFETAKNVSLYSWFVYRFHQVAELVAYSSLEMALRQRFYTENPDKVNDNRPPALFTLLQHAKVEGWIKNEDFPSKYDRARHSAEQRKMMETIMKNNFEVGEIITVDMPSEGEIEAELAEINLVERLSTTVHKLRNDLAHGSETLRASSLQTLRTTSEMINQIYP